MLPLGGAALDVKHDSRYSAHNSFVLGVASLLIVSSTSGVLLNIVVLLEISSFGNHTDFPDCVRLLTNRESCQRAFLSPHVIFLWIAVFVKLSHCLWYARQEILPLPVSQGTGFYSCKEHASDPFEADQTRCLSRLPNCVYGVRVNR